MNDCEQLENLEDIESRLYSELYHNVEAYQDSPQTVEQPLQDALPDVVPEMRRAPPRPRYFQHVLNNSTRPEASSAPAPETPTTAQLLSGSNYVQEPVEKVPEIPHESLPFSPTMAQLLSRGNYVQLPAKEVEPVKTVPEISHERLPSNFSFRISRDPREALVKPVSRRQRKRANRNLRRTMKTNPVALSYPPVENAPPQKGIVTIFVSDSDDDVVELEADPVLIEGCEDGTEVIFVPNPPPEIITVDEDPEPDKLDDSISSHASEASKNSAEKDDFISAHDIELNHAPQFSEFDKPEFLKPATQTPQTPCGSESTSSCTIDFAALQTGPFTEHEFPQNASLFEDENLVSFGNLITPGGRRQTTPKNDLLENSVTSTPLSSKFKKLPTLSHIDKRTVNDSDQEPAATKRKSSQDSMGSKKSLKNKKKKHKASDEEEPEPEVMNEELVEEPRKKSKKKTRWNSEDNTREKVVVEETEIVETPRKSKKNKRKDTSETFDSFLVTDEANESRPSKKRQSVIGAEKDETPKKSKNKKRDANDTLDSFLVVDEANESRTSRKRQTVIEEEGEEHEEEETAQELPKKSKNKKRDANDTLDSFIVVDEANESRTSRKRQTVIEEEGEEHEEEETAQELPKKSKNKKRDTHNGSDSSVVIDETIDNKISKRNSKQTVIEEEEVSEEVTDEVPKKTKNKKRDTNDAANSLVVVDEVNEIGIDKEKQVVVEVEQANETPKKSKNKKRGTIDALSSFVILDETNESVVVPSSDSDDLSELPAGEADIQLLNCSPHLLHHPVQDDESTGNNSSKPVDLRKESVDEVLRRMSNDPRQWAVLESDRLRLRTKGTGRRCNRCREVGHPAIRCPNKVSPKCNLCGAEHYESRCPDKMCTGCGRSQGYSSSYCKYCFNDRNQQCEICWNNGHGSQSCPDLWRRYHLTTEEGPLVRHTGPSSKPKSQLWCSGCARSGHLVHECRVFINSDYPKSDPFIRSYKDIYTPEENSQDSYNAQSAQYGIPPLLLPNEFQQNFYFNQSHCGGGGGGGNLQGQYNVNFYNNAQNYQNNNRSIAQLQLIQALIPQNNVTFHDQLPSYINLNSSTPQPQPQPQQQLQQQQQQQQQQHQQQHQQQQQQNFVSNFVDNDQSNLSPAERRILRNAHANTALFYKKSPHQIRQFIHFEFQKLDKYKDNLKGIVGDLRRNIDNQRPNYRNLNMVLFGVYHLNDGSLHLDKLRNFRSCHPRVPLTIAKRRDLFKAYNYIFGTDGHEDDDTYKDLLLNAI